MKLESRTLVDGARVPVDHAFCDWGSAEAGAPFSPAPNRSPHLAWSDVPSGTRSFVVLCVDPDAPSRPDDVNKPDREVPADLPRVDFYHQVLVDVPASVRELEEGADGHGVTPRGKPQDGGPGRRGLNDYTGWFAGDPAMEGRWFGYDGPCPPFNDARVHRYFFTVWAVDVERLAVEGAFTGREVRAALEGHGLAQASLVGTYTLNPRLRPTHG